MAKKWKTQKQYKSSPSECPRCGSGDISGDGVEVDDGFASQSCRCEDCDARWEDQYQLKRYVKWMNADA